VTLVERAGERAIGQTGGATALRARHQSAAIVNATDLLHNLHYG
jgi:hypothetical protein